MIVRRFRFAILLVLIGLFAMPAAAQDDLAEQAAELQASTLTVEYYETTVTFENQGQKIIGTLAMPASDAPVPLVLLFHGFKGERDELPVMNTDEGMYGRTARIFAERGVASLRIDFRGSGESDGLWEDTTFTGQASDAIAAIDFVGSLPGVDPERIGIIGLSQGGMVASLTASQDPRVKSVVLWSPVANPASNYTNIMPMDTIRQGLALADGEALPVTLPWGEETSMKRPFFEELFTVDPVAAITRYAGPLLVIVGSRDTTVYPQPQQGQVYVNYHEGDEALVVLDGDHVFDVLATGPDVLDEAIFNSLAWLLNTL
jgi:cephalosporin-C deacetylase-like acetyl esterase